MNKLAREMRDAGALFSDTFIMESVKFTNEKSFDPAGVPNADIVLAVLKEEINYEEGLYMAMERAKPYKPPTIAGAASVMAGAVNGMSGSAEKSRAVVSDVFSVEHRTLQQLIFSIYVIPIVRTLANMGRRGWVDARNQRSAEIAMEMDVVLERIARENGGEIYLPFI